MKTLSLILLSAVALGVGGTAAAADAAAQTSLAKSDLAFVEMATQAGLFEIKSSELAVKRGGDADEQALAKQMIEDHTKAGNELAALAAKKGVTAATELDKKHQEKVDKLGAVADKDFAKEYVEAQVKAHKQAVDLFTDESKDGKDADLRAFAAETLPTLKTHLEHAKAVAAKQ